MPFRKYISEKIIDQLLLRYSKNAPWPWYNKLIQLDPVGRDEILQLQWQNFTDMLGYAEQNVPYYSESFASAGICVEDIKRKEDLLSIPEINKKQIAANFPDRITSTASDQNSWQYIATSGTTDRLMVVIDDETASRNEALSLYGEQIRRDHMPGALTINIPPDACSLACAVNSHRDKSIRDRWQDVASAFSQKGISGLTRSMAGKILRKISMPAIEMPSFGPSGTRVEDDLLKWYYETIQRKRPAVLSGLPTYLLILSRYIKKYNLQAPEIGSLLPQGSLSPPALKREISAAFKAPVHEVYGAHELGSVATTCIQRDKLHINMTGFLVEVVKDGKHAAPGELGEIVISSLINSAMPMIRYKPGDVGRLYEDPCACGRQSQLLVVEGRLQDTMVTSNGIFTSQMVTDYFNGLENIEFFQMTQRDDARCDLLIVEKNRGQTNKKELAAAVQEYLGSELRIRPRLVSTIKPEVSGKFRFVKSKSVHRFHNGTSPVPETAEYQSEPVIQPEDDIEDIVDAVWD